MESGFIADEALSTSLDHGNPHDSRLGKEVKEHGGWLASPYENEDYLQIDLAVLYSFTKIAVEGEWSQSGMANKFVRKYQVMISNDSLVWHNYTENSKLKVFPSSQLSVSDFNNSSCLILKTKLTVLYRLALSVLYRVVVYFKLKIECIFFRYLMVRHLPWLPNTLRL